jgi:hypothetical protein
MSKNKINFIWFLIPLIIFQLSVGIISNSEFILEDTGIHSMMTNVLKQGWPNDYGDVSNTKFTYPPLFHFFSLILSFFGISQINAVKLIGLLVFMAIPVSFFFLSSIFNKKYAIIGSLISTVIVNVTILMNFSQFPQLLAINLLCFHIFFFFKDKYLLSGIFAGLTILSHPFIGFFTGFLLLLKLALYRDKNVFKTIIIAFLISLIWLFKYILILFNIFTNSWNNTRWYFMGYGFRDGIINLLFERFSILILILAMFGAIFMFQTAIKGDKKHIYFLILFMFTLFFTFYHRPEFQLKMLDMLTISFIPLSIYFISMIEKINYSKYLILFIVIILLVSAYNPILHTYKIQEKNNALDKDLFLVAKWLKNYDIERSKIILDINSSQSFKNNLSWDGYYFNSELLFAEISNKIPMEAIISDLESYSEEYKQQLIDREEIINGNFDLLKKYNIKYYIGLNNCPGFVIWNDSSIVICQLY